MRTAPLMLAVTLFSSSVLPAGTAQAGELRVCPNGTKNTVVAALGEVYPEDKDLSLSSTPTSSGDCDVSYIHPKGSIPKECEGRARITATGKVTYDEDKIGTIEAESITCEPLKKILSPDCQEDTQVRIEGKMREVVRDLKKGALTATDDPNVFKLQQNYTLDDRAHVHLADPASVKPCPVSVLVFTKGLPPQNCSAGGLVSASGRITAFVGDGGKVNMALVVDPEPECRR